MPQSFASEWVQLSILAGVIVFISVQKRLEEERAQIADEFARTNKALDSVSTQHARQDGSELVAARKVEEHASTELSRTVNTNPVFRLTSMIYGIAPEALTDEQLATRRAFFSIFGAVMISVGGTAPALVHYWPKGAGKVAPSMGWQQ